ncbi:single-stranded DNA-binding protein [Colobine gammaherpesvirus 1]|uniref:Single-stranded DNA-binding protein n=1 Tax=Colobine gammaherpesvirus 1 TaxID=2597325 RepID=A0A5B8FKL1_9GAMA|nr:single-stranded DNA-binding protein [Colobine gammaherpesvirus 1]QDQ69213.1 single-stranded DNA-binding protein [Colobine gammaherpesvirus 1]
MTSKFSQGQPSEDNLGSSAPTGPCGYVYAYSKVGYPFREASLLGSAYPDARVVSLPLLHGLTVETDFALNVKAIYKKLDATTVAVKVTTYHREVLVFDNARLFQPLFQGPGLEKLCRESRELFGFSEFVEPQHQGAPWDHKKCPQLPSAEEIFLAVIVTEGFKERLYGGKLVPVPCQTQAVRIGESQAFKIPLFDEELFGTGNPKCPPRFYNPDISHYLHDSLYTGLAQALRIKDICAVIQAAEKQFVQEHYKVAKLVQAKDFPQGTTRGADGATLAVLDSLVTELGMSYGLSFIEGPQDGCETLHYDTWPIFENCTSPDDRVRALEVWNAEQALHISTQLFSANSVLYVTRLAKLHSKTPKVDINVYNSFYLQHGLGYLSEATVKENGIPAFKGVPATVLEGNAYTLQHLAYAASFSPHILAKMCYYLQFIPHHKNTNNPSYDVVHYVGTAATSPMCDLCRGECPTVCIHTLFYRLQDRFPPVLANAKRDPYVVTGTAGAYNDLEILGNFAAFREREEDGNQVEETPKYTYWQLCQNLMEKLASIGVSETGDSLRNLIVDIPSFIKVFKTIDSIVDVELLKFINCMVKNNYNFREHIKSIHHILQFTCNVYWQAPCTVFLNLYYRSLLTMVQDVCLTACMLYEQDNPAVGISPSEWLKMHFQTMWTNFKGACFDKGAITGSELKIVHQDMFCNFFDTDAAIGGMLAPARAQVRISRAMIMMPRTIKIKNRIIFSNSVGTEAIQAGFIKSAAPKDSYVVCGPYMKFLHSLHKILFPTTKTSALYMWHKISQTSKTPVVPGVPEDQLTELCNYVKSSSQAFDEANVLDIVPDTLTSYAKIKLNSNILRACGQTQFYATTLSCLTPAIQPASAEEYPHALGPIKISSPDDYRNRVAGKTVTIVQSTLKNPVSNTGRLRPILTVPLMVNKYTGSNGNANIFHCANLGYFFGRGVDRNLRPDSMPFKKGSVSSLMRKRHVIMTPTLDRLVKRQVGVNTGELEVEVIKRLILTVLENKENPNPARSVVLELVRHLGNRCEHLSEEDVIYYLGNYSILGEDIEALLRAVRQAGVPWTVEGAENALRDEPGEELEFVGSDDVCAPQCQQVEDFFPASGIPSLAAGKKRKITSLLSDLDL